MVSRRENEMRKFYSPLRYPGGKTFLAFEFEKIIEALGLEKPVYIEPYAGGAGAALRLLYADRVSKIVINDKDPKIFSFWKSVTKHPKKFAQKILNTPVNLEEWERQRKIYLNSKSTDFDLGFATFYLNRTNRSGLIKGGPIGGKEQNGKYKIDARFNRKDLADRVLKIGKFKNRIEISNKEGIDVAKKYLGEKNIFIYLDPPYFVNGKTLYFTNYKESHHEKLAKLLNANADKNWLLTYDERVKIRKLYKERKRQRRPFHYRVRDSRKARELIIYSNTTFT